MASLKVTEKRKNYISINNDDYAIAISENDMGIIVDVFFRNGDLINTDTYWKHLDYPSVYGDVAIMENNLNNLKKHMKELCPIPFGTKHNKGSK